MTSSQGSIPLLYAETNKQVFDSFDRWGHRVTKKNREAISALSLCLSQMANSALDRKYYLSTMDVGLGKSVTIKRFLKTLLETPSALTSTNLRHHQVGVLLCLSTYDEIASVLSPELDRETGEVVIDTIIDPTKVFVMVSTKSDEGKRVSAMGKAASPQEAQIVITTHAKVEVEFTKAGNNKFWDHSLFSYEKGFRIVRIWDEAFIPNRPHQITTRSLLKFQSWLDGRVPEQLMTDLHNMVGAMRSIKSKGFYEVPDLEEAFGNTFDHVEGMIRRSPKKSVGDLEDVLQTLQALRVMSGCVVSVRKYDGSSKAALTYEPMIPKDFAPVIIADASGQFKKVYDEIEGRGELVRLKSVRKTYAGNLDIHWYDRASGRGQWSAFVEKGQKISGFDRLVEDLCKVILEEPDRHQLVVTFKPNLDGPYRGRFPSIEEAVRKRLRYRYRDYDPVGPDPDRPRLAFLTFGKHRATNQFKSYPVVTLAGVLIKSLATNEALLRASREFKPQDGAVSDEDLLTYRGGEIADDLCQAAGRGSIRETDHDEPWKCPKGSRLNIIASRATGVHSLLPYIYGSATSITFHSDETKSGTQSLFDEVVAELKLAAKARRDLKFAEFRKLRDWAGRKIPVKRLQDSVRTDPRYPDMIARLGFEEASNEGGKFINQWRYKGTLEQLGF